MKSICIYCVFLFLASVGLNAELISSSTDISESKYRYEIKRTKVFVFDWKAVLSDSERENYVKRISTFLDNVKKFNELNESSQSEFIAELKELYTELNRIEYGEKYTDGIMEWLNKANGFSNPMEFIEYFEVRKAQLL